MILNKPYLITLTHTMMAFQSALHIRERTIQ